MLGTCRGRGRRKFRGGLLLRLGNITVRFKLNGFGWALGDGKEERGKRIRTLLAFLEVGDAGLEFEDVSAEEVGGAGAVCTGLRECALRCGLHVETGCEGAVAGSCKDYGADGGVVGELAEDGGEVVPHAVVMLVGI